MRFPTLSTYSFHPSFSLISSSSAAMNRCSAPFGFLWPFRTMQTYAFVTPIFSATCVKVILLLCILPTMSPVHCAGIQTILPSISFCCKSLHKVISYYCEEHEYLASVMPALCCTCCPITTLYSKQTQQSIEKCCLRLLSPFCTKRWCCFCSTLTMLRCATK